MRSLLFAVIAVAGCAQQEAPAVACVALIQGCSVEQGKLFAKTDSVPTPLKPFALTVAAPTAKEVHVELHMQGMEMGLNRYRLIRQDNGEWRATLTLPACVAGRRDWLMVIEVDGARRTLAFQAG
ncbi:MAG: hypothetical protein HZA59_12140 [Hydrogenophilales bacterium]|nr:hypothetical protein [Hydrogenophilales bacterium]